MRAFVSARVLWFRDKSAGTSTFTVRGRVREAGSFLIGRDTGRLTIDRFIHPFTDDIHQLVKDLLHVDVVFSAGLKELEAWMPQRPIIYYGFIYLVGFLG